MNAVLDKLSELKGVFTGKHFVYKSWKHGSGYVNIDPALPEVGLMVDWGGQLADPFLDTEFTVVVAPATGGIVLGFCAALYADMLSPQRVVFVWADKDGDDFVFERQGFAQRLTGQKVLVVDDIMTNANSGGSAYKLCRLVEQHGGEVIGVSLICNRCGGTAEDLGVARLEQLSEVSFEATSRDQCEADGLCAQEVPIVNDIGHGAKFQAKHNPTYTGGYESLLG